MLTRTNSFIVYCICIVLINSETSPTNVYLGDYEFIMVINEFRNESSILVILVYIVYSK